MTENFFLDPPTVNNSIQAFVEDGALEWGLYVTTFCIANEMVNSTDLLDQGVELNVYPNPSRGRLTVELQGLQIGATDFTVIDQTGRILFSQRHNAANGRNEIDLGEVPSGSYLLRITNGQGPTTQRLMVL